MHRIQSAPQGCSAPLKGGASERLVQSLALRPGIEVEQHLFEPTGAMKVWRARVRHAARMGLRKCQPGGQAAWRLGHPGSIDHESQLRHAPGRFHAVDRL
jgi:hypothetical protein